MQNTRSTIIVPKLAVKPSISFSFIFSSNKFFESMSFALKLRKGKVFVGNRKNSVFLWSHKGCVCVINSCGIFYGYIERKRWRKRWSEKAILFSLFFLLFSLALINLSINWKKKKIVNSPWLWISPYNWLSLRRKVLRDMSPLKFNMMLLLNWFPLKSRVSNLFKLVNFSKPVKQSIITHIIGHNNTNEKIVRTKNNTSAYYSALV